MKKTVALFLSALLCIAFLASCAPKLPDGMTQDEVNSAGENVINLLNAQDYDALNANLNSEMATALESTPLNEIWAPVYAELGDFSEIEKSTITAQNGYAVYVAQVKYVNNTIVLTLSFDKDYKLAGLFYK